MKYEKIHGTDLNVSKLCLGTMTWGRQNTMDDALNQLDYAFSRGINFIDTAEIYPIPPDKQTYGETERILGEWLKKTGKRDKVIIASKIAGPDRAFDYIRNPTTMTRENVREAVHSSLKRLGTDYIDLYQVHWPERSSNYFGQRAFKQDLEQDSQATPIAETLDGLHDLMKEGLIRHIGVSNESSWGLMEYLRQHEIHGKPRIVTVQNVYNLLNRLFEVGSAEIAIRENVKLLAYSPLAFGVLSGKYLNGKRPAFARLTLYSRFKRYLGEHAEMITGLYDNVAKKHHLSLTQMSLAFVNQQPFVVSNIIGATTIDQLRQNINSMDVALSEDLLKDIEEINNKYYSPCP